MYTSKQSIRKRGGSKISPQRVLYCKSTSDSVFRLGSKLRLNTANHNKHRTINFEKFYESMDKKTYPVKTTLVDYFLNVKICKIRLPKKA